MRVVDDATFGAARRSNLCCPISLVAIASSNEAFNYFRCSAPASEVKTTELEKSYKIKLKGLWISNTVERGVVAKRNARPQSYSGAVSLGTIDPE
jgi:hypothetical protein